jgi:glycosyltransferase involved in cell wall biosynthesis
MNKKEICLKKFLYEERNVINQNSINTIIYPRISIITPSYNQGLFLERTIRSVLNQSYANLEYIIIDGGSIDDSVNIIKRYEKQLTYWISEPDSGQSDAIIKGFSVATGDIWAWLNSDDVYWPGALDFIAKYFMDHPHVDVIYGDSFTIDEHDHILRETRSVKFSKLGFLTRSFSLHQASIFWRKRIYIRSDGINKYLHLAMDPDLWMQFHKSGATFRHVQRTLSCYRDHAKTKTRLNSIETCSEINQRLQVHYQVNTAGLKYKCMRYIMRLRTLCLHIIMGNINYLYKNAGKKI